MKGLVRRECQRITLDVNRLSCPRRIPKNRVAYAGSTVLAHARLKFGFGLPRCDSLGSDQIRRPPLWDRKLIREAPIEAGFHRNLDLADGFAFMTDETIYENVAYPAIVVASPRPG